MFNFKQRPCNLLLLTALLILLASFFVFDKTLDIHVHDTYFILELPLVFRAMCILLLILWTLYLLTKPFLYSKVLIWIHTLLIVASALSLLTLSVFSTNYYNGLAGMPRRYYDYGSWNTIARYDNLTTTFLIAFLLIVLGQLTYLINLIFGLIKKKR